MPSDEEYRQFFARRYDLSEITDNVSRMDGKLLALAAALRPLVVVGTGWRPGEDMKITQENVKLAEYAMAVMAPHGIEISEGRRGLPKQREPGGPYVLGGPPE